MMRFSYWMLRDKLIFRDKKTMQQIIKEELNIDAEEVIVASNCIYVEGKDKIYIINWNGILERDKNE